MNCAEKVSIQPGMVDRREGHVYLNVYQPWTGDILVQLPLHLGQEIAIFEKALGQLRKDGRFIVTGDAIHTQVATFEVAKKKMSCF